MKKLLSAILVLMLAATMLSSATLAETYSATVDGRNAPITVEVSIDNSVIAAVTVTEQTETPEITAGAIKSIPADIVAAQSITVDSVAGATITSDAIKAAVRACIEQAGLNVADYAVAPPKAEIIKSEVSLSTDVLVIGAGGSGLAASAEAAQRGASVIVLEKQATIGGSTAMSAGAMLGFAEDESADALTLDELKQLFAMYSAESSEHFDKTISDDFMNNLNASIQWTIDQGYVTNYNGYYPSFTRLDKADRNTYFVHVLVQGGEEGFAMFGGTGLTDTLAARTTENGGTILTGTAATSLLVNENGAVYGAIAESSDAVYTIEAKSVILATGGWGSNLAMSQEIWPNASLQWWGTPGDTGDGIVMAKAIGAKVEMDSNCLCVSYDVSSLGAFPF